MVTLSSLRRSIEAQQRTTGLDSAEVIAIAGSGGGGGVVWYDTLDSLPISGLSAGDEAFVEENKRLYVSDGAGWYNVTLVNRTPSWASGGEPDAFYTILDSATPLVITAKAIDSDNSNAQITNQSTVTDSAQYMVNISNDSSVFTFTPKSADSIGVEVAAGNLIDSDGDFTYTFKWSDGISFVSKAVTIAYNPSSQVEDNWAIDATNPYIAWVDPADAGKIRFAIPANGAIGTWHYGTSYPNISGSFNAPEFVSVPSGVIHNGVTYDGYYMSSAWTAGNTNYQQWNTSVSSPDYTTETLAQNNSLGNFP